MSFPTVDGRNPFGAMTAKCRVSILFCYASISAQGLLRQRVNIYTSKSLMGSGLTRTVPKNSLHPLLKAIFALSAAVQHCGLLLNHETIAFQQFHHRLHVSLEFRESIRRIEIVWDPSHPSRKLRYALLDDPNLQCRAIIISLCLFRS